MHTYFDIIVIGGGPAGLTAAIYARRAGKSVLVLEKSGIGGQIAASPRVENFPGFSTITGQELADRIYSQAELLGARIELEEVLRIQDGTFKTVLTDYGTYTCQALILATGTAPCTLGFPEEEHLVGISFCAVCDGAFYQGRDTAVCGGGNTALQEALFLSELCRHVTLIHRRAAFRGDPILVEALRGRQNVTLLTDTLVDGLISRDGVLTGVSLHNNTKDVRTTLSVEALFEAVGRRPESVLAQSLQLADQNGFIQAGEDCRTSRIGIFTAGDCRTKHIRQLTTACADGAVAALAACQYCDPSFAHLV